MYAADILNESEIKRANIIAKIMTAKKTQQNQLMAFLITIDRTGYCAEYLGKVIPLFEEGQNIKISFNWSKSRWEEEYQKMIRRESVLAVLQEYRGVSFPNVRNGCLHPIFKKLLDDTGLHHTLIETPVRLALEGLEQNHCIGNSDYRNEAGSSLKMFLSMICNKKRWTVEVYVRDNKAYVATILGKNNSAPDSKSRKAINHRLAKNINETKPPEKGVFSGSIQINIKQLMLSLPPNIRELYGVSRLAEVPGINDYILSAIKSPEGKKLIDVGDNIRLRDVQELKLASSVRS